MRISIPRYAKTSSWLIAVLFTALPAISAAEPLKITAINAPLAEFAKRLGGDAVTVSIPVPASEDPMTFQPPVAVIGEVQKSDLILLNGAGYANWVEKVSLPRSKTVDTSGAFAADFIEATDVITHSHGDEGAHAHDAVANTTWLDFEFARLQAGEVAKAIIRKDPALKETVEAQLVTLQTDLHNLHERTLDVVATLPAPAIASHPRYEYFARAYDIEITALHWEAEDVPDADALAELDAIIADTQAKLFIWELQPNPEAEKLVAARGLVQVVFNPGDNTPGYIALMNANLNALDKIE